MVLGVEVGLSPGEFVLDGDQRPPEKGGGALLPIFGPFLLWSNSWMHQGATWYRGRPWPRRLCGTWHGGRPQPKTTLYWTGTHLPPPPKGSGDPQFSAHVYCGQTAAWIKVPLGMEVGLGPDDFVFDGDPATPREKGTRTPPNFWPMSTVAKRLDGSRWHLSWRWA